MRIGNTTGRFTFPSGVFWQTGTQHVDYVGASLSALCCNVWRVALSSMHKTVGELWLLLIGEIRWRQMCRLGGQKIWSNEKGLMKVKEECASAGLQLNIKRQKGWLQKSYTTLAVTIKKLKSFEILYTLVQSAIKMATAAKKSEDWDFKGQQRRN